VPGHFTTKSSDIPAAETASQEMQGYYTNSGKIYGETVLYTHVRRMDTTL
jgi:hypothetical protein